MEAGSFGARVPVLRDLAGSSYMRQEGDGLLVGPYEQLPEQAVHAEWGRRGPPLEWETASSQERFAIPLVFESG